MKHGQTHEERQEFWRKHVDDWKASGKTKKIFCEERGLAYYSFLRWCSRLKEEEAKHSSFVEVGAPQHSKQEPPARIEIEQPVDIAVAGTTIRVNRWIEEEALSRIVRAVERR